MENSIFFLSYDEPNANENFAKLQKLAPRSIRIQGIHGILAAHQACAEQSSTPFFYLMDGDNEVMDTFDFSFSPTNAEQNSVYVWRCKNPVNDLVYGYGAIKLFPKSLFSLNTMPVDLATTAAKKYIIMPETASITRFNTSPLATWRAAFRECVKLASGLLHNQNAEETLARLDTWCTVGKERPFGAWCMAGAKAGKQYGLLHKNNASALQKINDYTWLKEQFSGALNEK